MKGLDFDLAERVTKLSTQKEKERDLAIKVYKISIGINIALIILETLLFILLMYILIFG